MTYRTEDRYSGVIVQLKIHRHKLRFSLRVLEEGLVPSPDLLPVGLDPV